MKYRIDLQVPEQHGPRLQIKGVTINKVEGSNDYEDMVNKPQINSVTLTGNKQWEDLGAEKISNEEILSLLEKGED